MIKVAFKLIFNQFFQNLILKVLHEKKKWCVNFFCMSSCLVKILFHDNVQPHLARIMLQKLTDLGCETFPHPPYSSDLSPTDYYFLKHLNTFFKKKKIPFQRRSTSYI